jgi:epoxyqueuosine reductase
MMDRKEFQELAENFGIDLVGVTTCERLEPKVPESARPSQISNDLPTFVVLAKHIPIGVSGARDGDAKQFAGSLLHRVLEEAAGDLAYALEARDYMAVVLPSLIMDFKSRDELSNTPAGQGSLYLRLAAVEAGMGTLGLNNMLLTPQFGPRVYLCGMMANLELEPDTPLEGELCLGPTECGRCAAICPAGAIPRAAPADTPLAAIRGLDQSACARYGQPHGVQAFIDYFKRLLPTENSAGNTLDSTECSRLWFDMAIARQGAFTGCSRCLQVCPVGADFERLQESPHRRGEL